MGPGRAGTGIGDGSKVNNRFDNLSLEELVEREQEAQTEANAVADALKARLLMECPLKIGMVYTIKSEALWAGVDFLICSLRPDSFWLGGNRHRFYLGVHGYRANKRSTAGDGFGIKPHVIRNWKLLDVTTEREGPRSSLVEYAKIQAKIHEAALHD